MVLGEEQPGGRGSWSRVKERRRLEEPGDPSATYRRAPQARAGRRVEQKGGGHDPMVTILKCQRAEGHRQEELSRKMVTWGPGHVLVLGISFRAFRTGGDCLGWVALSSRLLFSDFLSTPRLVTEGPICCVLAWCHLLPGGRVTLGASGACVSLPMVLSTCPQEVTRCGYLVTGTVPGHRQLPFPSGKDSAPWRV